MIKVDLPIDFVNRMKAELGEEFDDFLKTYNREPEIALRVNTLKISAEDFKREFDFCKERVEWCADGFYYDGKPGSLPAFSAGLFYSQEPSAMLTAEIAQIQKGDFVLDLCAAPGGKSTHIASKLGGTGLLVSNEIVPERARILNENMERSGVKNAVITNMHPEKMAVLFENFFDKIVVDAPCSGEGMFRKDARAAEEWSIEHTYSCASRQLAIVHSAEKMLRCGGMLIYSTCTFSREENEELCKKVCEELPFELVEMHRLLPHKHRCEGHFCALLKKRGSAQRQERPKIKNYDKEKISLYRAFEKDNLNITLDGDFAAFGDNLFLLPPGFGDLGGIKSVCPGIRLGEVRKGRFIPAHQLCMCLEKNNFKRSISLSDEEIIKYRHGEAVLCNSQSGFGAMLYKDKYPLGWYKYSNGCAKNHYPKYLRAGV